MSTSGFLSKPYTVRLEKLLSNGFSLTHADGMATFVPYGIPGEEVQIEITESHKGYLVGKILGISDSSPDRIKPRCPLFGRCGGCTLQHIAYPRQLELKKEMLLETLERTGHISAPPVTVHPSQPYGYRARVQLHPAPGGGAGFMELGTNTVIPVSNCPICCPGINQVLSSAGQSAIERRTTFFSPDGNQVFSAASGSRTIDIEIKGRALKASPQCFFQSNPAMFQALLARLDSLVENGTTYLDLYSGIGLPGIFFQERFKHLFFVEESPVSARYGALNTQKYTNCHFFNMKCEDWTASKRRCKRADTVVADPPRTGLSDPVRQYLIKLKAKQFFYISCNFVTLARDLGELVRNGYTIQSFDMFDFYPQTQDMECLVGVTYGS